MNSELQIKECPVIEISGVNHKNGHTHDHMDDDDHHDDDHDVAVATDADKMASLITSISGGRSDGIRKRKQEHPKRALKQLANVADKVLHGIIIIEPFLPWERTEPLRPPPYRDDGFLKPARKKSRNRSRSFGDDDSDAASSSSSLGSPGGVNARPTVTRSPAPMGHPLPEDTIEPGISQRRDQYEYILSKRRNGPSRAGMPLDITQAPGASLLDRSEFEVCSVLRLYPLQYFQSRDTLIHNYHQRGFYKKSAAQKMLHIDVNKTGKLYDYFVGRGWMPNSGAPVDVAMVRDPAFVNWHAIEP